MKLSDIDLMKLIPLFMQDDEAVNGLAAGANKIIPQLYAEAKLFQTWDKIDDMGHEDLDALAWELNITWYDPNASLDIKRRLVKKSDLVYARLGTKWAVEQVISDLYNNSEVVEWFEYDMQKPFYFKLLIADIVTNEQEYERLLRAVNETKNVRSWLDKIIFRREASATIFTGMTVKHVRKSHIAAGTINQTATLQLSAGIAIKHTRRSTIHCQLGGGMF